MDVLTHAHTPQDHRGFRFSKLSGYFTQAFCRNPTNRSHCFRAITFNIFFESLKIRSAILDELLITQTFFDHGVNHGVEHGHIRIGLELQGPPGVLPNIRNAWICQNNFGTVLRSVFHPSGCDWVISSRIRSNHHNQTRVLNIIHLITNGARANTLKQCSHARCMA